MLRSYKSLQMASGLRALRRFVLIRWGLHNRGATG
jgi:hypothetical protein